MSLHDELKGRGVLWKKVLLKMSQNSQENTCARVWIKLQAWDGLTRDWVINEAVRTMLICCSHRSAGVHEAMTNLTGIRHRTREQHIELRASKQLRDAANFEKKYLF